MTLDGQCKHCHIRNGMSRREFSDITDATFTELKNALRTAPDETTCFNAYTQALAAGIPVGLVKQIMAAPRESKASWCQKLLPETKRSSSGQSSNCIRKLEIHEDNMRICVGLGGAEISLSVWPEMSMKDVITHVSESFPHAATVKFLACNSSIYSLDELLLCHRIGVTIKAIMVKQVEDMSLSDVQAELAVDGDVFAPSGVVLQDTATA